MEGLALPLARRGPLVQDRKAPAAARQLEWPRPAGSARATPDRTTFHRPRLSPRGGGRGHRDGAYGVERGASGAGPRGGACRGVPEPRPGRTQRRVLVGEQREPRLWANGGGSFWLLVVPCFQAVLRGRGAASGSSWLRQENCVFCNFIAGLHRIFPAGLAVSCRWNLSGLVFRHLTLTVAESSVDISMDLMSGFPPSYTYLHFLTKFGVFF